MVIMHRRDHDADSLRVGVRRVIPAWEFRHLRVLGFVRLGGAALLATCGLLTLSFGGNDLKTYGWAAVFLVLAALNLAGGVWELTIARSASSRRR